MAKLLEIFSTQKRLWQQRREIDQLRQELAKLRAQNDSMREGIRRCVTCDYRIDFKQRQDNAGGEQ
jgi:cell division protein FtsB